MMALCLGMGSMAQAADGHFGADRHVARGLTCESCHGKNMDMKNPEIPTIETCTGCHNTKDLVAKTKDVKPKDVKPKDVKPKDVKPKDVKPKDVKPKDVKPKDVKPKDVKPKDVKPKDVKPKDVKPKDVKPKDVKPTNPHMSPHYQDTLDCTNCHLMHSEPDNFCNQCHQFDFKVR